MSGRIRVAPAEERTADNIVFHSKREMDVYLQFRALERSGAIGRLELQVPFQIFILGPSGQDIPVFKWIADFVITEKDGTKRVYDVKGMRTDLYRLKKKCVEAQYGIRIVEI